MQISPLFQLIGRVCITPCWLASHQEMQMGQQPGIDLEVHQYDRELVGCCSQSTSFDPCLAWTYYWTTPKATYLKILDIKENNFISWCNFIKLHWAFYKLSFRFANKNNTLCSHGTVHFCKVWLSMNRVGGLAPLHPSNATSVYKL